MGRILHYLKKFWLQLRSQGWLSTLQTTFQFLWRRKLGLQLISESIEYHFWSRYRSISDTLIAKIECKPLESKRALIYVSFDRESTIRPHVLDQLRFFSGQGYDPIFVTTSPCLDSVAIALLKPFCSLLIHRKNVGYDFASYRLGYEWLQNRVSTLESLVVMNDSCIGPLFDFGPHLQQMVAAPGSVYGLTKSLEISEHIQSYFYHFGAHVNQSGATKKFFDRIRILESKWAIVRFFEIGSSMLLQREGIHLRALVDPTESVIAARLQAEGLTEPTREPLASEWVEQKRLPFKKRSVSQSSSFNLG